MLVYLHKKETRQFFEGRLDGASIFMRAGRQGEDGESTRRNFASVVEARREFEKILSVALAKGFVRSKDPREAEEEEAAATAAQMADDLTVETEDGERHERNPQLEAAILASPDDRAVYEVFGDWLQDRRDPRGKLIALQCRLQDGADEAVRAAESTYRERNAWCLLGADYQVLQGDGLEWRYGFLRRVKLPMRGRPHPDVPGVVGRLLALPVSRFLEELEVSFESNPYGAMPATALGSLSNALAKDSLRRLSLHGVPGEDPAGAAAINGFRALRFLRLPVQRVTGALDLPELETLEVFPVPAAELAAHRLPRLETLRIFDLDGEDEIAAVFSGGGAAFRSLSLPGARNTDEIVRVLVSSPVFARITALDLVGSDLTDAGVAVLLAGERRALTSLDLGGTRVSEACRARVTTAGIQVLRGRLGERAAYREDEDEYDEYEDEDYDENGEPREPSSETYDEEAQAGGGDDAQEGFSSLADGEVVAEQQQEAEELADVAEEEGEEAAAEKVIENEEAKFDQEEAASPEDDYPYDEDSGDG